MKLLLVRHGKAGDHDSWVQDGQNDELRPLTKKGVEEFKVFAKHLASIDRGFDKIYASPFLRTMQTAEILSDEYKLKVEKCSELRYDVDPEGLPKFIQKLNPEGSYILVGHEPVLGDFCSRMLSEEKNSFVLFKKGTAALLTSTSSSTPGSFILEWLIHPKILADD